MTDSITNVDSAYLEAQERASEFPESMAIISIGWQDELILPYQDGIQFMTLMEKAEVQMTERNDTSELSYKTIKPAAGNVQIRFASMDHQEYIQKKMSALLGVNVHE